MARRSPPRKVTYFEPVLPSLARNTIIGSTFEDRPPLPLHDARRLRPAGIRAMAPAYARAPRRRGACALAATRSISSPLSQSARLAVADA